MIKRSTLSPSVPNLTDRGQKYFVNELTTQDTRGCDMNDKSASYILCCLLSWGLMRIGIKPSRKGDKSALDSFLPKKPNLLALLLPFFPAVECAEIVPLSKLGQTCGQV